jgi:predicted porin
MQKKLIALAIAGLSGAAFAQTNVTISGNLDMGYYAQSMQTTTIMDTRTAAAANGSSTSTWRITGTEDLGGGMKAGFQLENDLAAGASSASSVINAGSSFLSLSGNWGTLKAGNVNTAGLTAGTTAQPFGTAIGGGYSGAFARLSRAGINGAAGTAAANATAGLMAEGENVTSATTGGTFGISGARTVRVNSSLHYATPSFSGFSATLQLATKNSDAAVAATGNTGGYQGLGLNYNNGPLNVAYANEQMSAGAVAPTGAGVTLGVNEKVTHNLLAANYTFGPATVYGGWTSSKSSVAATADSRSWNLALKYAMGNWAFMGNVVKVDDKLIGNQDRSLTGLGLDYALSKRTTAYGRYENGDNDKAAGATGNFSRYQIGMRHTF